MDIAAGDVMGGGMNHGESVGFIVHYWNDRCLDGSKVGGVGDVVIGVFCRVIVIAGGIIESSINEKVFVTHGVSVEVQLYFISYDGQ